MKRGIILFATERYEKIMEILREKRTIKVSALSELFGVSIETIRRDLDYLEKDGRLKKVYRGAALEQVLAQEKSLTSRIAANAGLKQKIARIACRYVEDFAL